MLSLLASAHLVLITSLLVGSSGIAQASASEHLVTASASTASASTASASTSDDSARPSARCIPLTDGVLDLRILANVTDVWSLDANASIGGSKGEVTLYVVSGSPTLTVSLQFDKLSDKTIITDADGKVTTLIPITTRDAVSTTASIAEGKTLEILALGRDGAAAAMIPGDPKPVGASNKAVIKPVTTCPT
jgi:hypothetical protein